ncbi:MAG: uracil-DNA glycosylase [Chloroflexi bacterium]|nr:uracil-DNA glycosylase [Chloroflexota bacterium]
MNHEAFQVPAISCDPISIRLVLIAEAPPEDASEGLWAGPAALHAQTTLLAFASAGLQAGSTKELLARGVYLTTAVKCAKRNYGIAPACVSRCSTLLEQELDLFTSVRGYLLMGDVAIRAFNALARRRTGKRVIPAGSTYKVRDGVFWYGDARVYPSYLQAGKSYFIEQSKRRMIAEDIAAALAWCGVGA